MAPRMARRVKTGPAVPTLTLDNDLDAGADTDCDDEKGPLRRCVVTRERGERAQMLRFVLAPDRIVVPDLAARLPGRGMWLSARGDVIDTACAKGAFARAARGPVAVPPELKDLIVTGLRRRVVELLGLSRRAGQAVAGFTKAREWVTGGRAACVLQAADGSPEERARLLSGARNIWVACPVDAASLGLVFGRDSAVHVAVAPGRLAGLLRIEVERLAGVSGQAMVEQAGE